MRIAQIAPLHESVPPKFYGGTERVVSYLTDALVELGHEVTLYATGDSITKATLRPIARCALRLDPHTVDTVAEHIYLCEKVFQESEEFDVLHSHIDYLTFPLFRRLRVARVTTLHGRLDIPNLKPVFREFRDEPVISISNHQRQPLSWVNWQATVYHGLPRERYHLRANPGSYLAFLGRISPEKRVDNAIRIARRAGIPLRIAAKVDKADQEYFQAVIKPMLGQADVEFIGEIGDGEKNEFLGNALALVFPIDWPEPFGLVMIESLACGTPVVACARGSVPEIIDHGITGFIARDLEEAIRAVHQVPGLSRRRCRQVFERRFTSVRMAQDYLAVYSQLMHARPESELTADSVS